MGIFTISTGKFEDKFRDGFFVTTRMTIGTSLGSGISINLNLPLASWLGVGPNDGNLRPYLGDDGGY